MLIRSGLSHLGCHSCHILVRNSGIQALMSASIPYTGGQYCQTEQEVPFDCEPAGSGNNMLSQNHL